MARLMVTDEILDWSLGGVEDSFGSERLISFKLIALGDSYDTIFRAVSISLRCKISKWLTASLSFYLGKDFDVSCILVNWLCEIEGYYSGSFFLK
jgi:hypothetical protein